MDFRPYVVSLLADLPQGAATRQIGDELVAELTENYTSLLATGLDEEAAARKTLFSFGAREALQSKLLEHKLHSGYQKFQQRYPLLRRIGFLGFLIVPLVCLVLMFSLNEKMAALATWIISIIAFATYLICLEYTYYHYQKKMLGMGKNISKQLMEWLKQPLHDDISKPRKKS